MPRAIPELPAAPAGCRDLVYSRVPRVCTARAARSPGWFGAGQTVRRITARSAWPGKAQQVKNAVIRSGGRQGCFCARRLPRGGNRDEIQQEAIACLPPVHQGPADLTDNLHEARWFRGPGRAPGLRMILIWGGGGIGVCRQGGLRPFRDIANGIAAEFRLLAGRCLCFRRLRPVYDHQENGINRQGCLGCQASGHFRELGLNVQTDPVTVIVLAIWPAMCSGNGIACCLQPEVVAAFNHTSIFFIRPRPVPRPASTNAAGCLILLARTGPGL